MIPFFQSIRTNDHRVSRLPCKTLDGFAIKLFGSICIWEVASEGGEVVGDGGEVVGEGGEVVGDGGEVVGDGGEGLFHHLRYLQ